MLSSHLGKASKLSKLELRTLGENGRATLVVQLGVTFAWEEDLLLYVVQATKGSYKSSCLTAEALHITIR
jgi:hypothetical protein